MKVQQFFWQAKSGWSLRPHEVIEADMLLIFGGIEHFKSKQILTELAQLFPQVPLMACSTAGEIIESRVLDKSLVATAVKFEKTQLKFAKVQNPSESLSRKSGEEIGKKLLAENLKHVFVLSPGLNVNGSELVRGITSQLPTHVSVTGGLASDGGAFQETFVTLGDQTANDLVAAVGFYGDHIKIGCGSVGGWDSFGPERLITKSSGNVLYELDGKSALELYKTYLGEEAKNLPASGLLFPLSLRQHEGNPGLVRTILSVDEKTQSLTFAGDVPEGHYVQLMKANFDRLLEGAESAAEASLNQFSKVQLAILISCVGRKLVLKQRIEDEVEGVRGILGFEVPVTGFYSYGEISPFTPTARCELHNQTMTVTTFAED